MKSSALKCSGKQIQMSRKVFFSSAHFYHQPKWSKEKNENEFGKCFSEFGHGHNYVLEAYFSGEIDSQTGLLVNLIDIEPVLKKVTDELDHRHLNFTHPYFKSHVPTTENIATYIWQQIQKEIPSLNVPSLRLQKIKLFEDEDLWAEVTL